MMVSAVPVDGVKTTKFKATTKLDAIGAGGHSDSDVCDRLYTDFNDDLRLNGAN